MYSESIFNLQSQAILDGTEKCLGIYHIATAIYRGIKAILYQSKISSQPIQHFSMLEFFFIMGATLHLCTLYMKSAFHLPVYHSVSHYNQATEPPYSHLWFLLSQTTCMGESSSYLRTA